MISSGVPTPIRMSPSRITVSGPGRVSKGSPGRLCAMIVAPVASRTRRLRIERPSGPLPVPKGDVVTQLLDNVPDSLLRPLVENKVIGVVLIAVAVGLAARKQTGARRFRGQPATVGESCDVVA